MHAGEENGDMNPSILPTGGSILIRPPPPPPKASRSPKSHVEAGEEESRPTTCGAESMPNHIQGDGDLPTGPVSNVDRTVSHSVVLGPASDPCISVSYQGGRPSVLLVSLSVGGRGVQARGGGPNNP